VSKWESNERTRPAEKGGEDDKVREHESHIKIKKNWGKKTNKTNKKSSTIEKHRKTQTNHDVHVQPVAAGLDHALAFLGEFGEVTRQ